MLVSFNWLKEYFEDTLPESKVIGNLLNSKSFQLEGIEEKGNDTLIDFDILPNRAHDCLCHLGIAKEISVLTGLKINLPNPVVNFENESEIKVSVEDAICNRYIAIQVSDVEVKETAKEIKEKIEAIGQKSINNIVDITNFVMFELGQPLHAFDKDKLDGDIVVRKAKNGEKLTTLDNKELILSEDILVIADSKDVLAIAGVKGGKKAEVDLNTKNIVIESANFAYSNVRKASQKVGIQTDSSKRFENEIAPEVAMDGALRAVELILKHAGGRAHKPVDIFEKQRKFKPTTGVSVKEVNSLLGLKLNESDIEDTFNKLVFEYEKVKTKEVALKTAFEMIGKKHNTFPSLRYNAPEEFDCSTLSAYSYLMGGLAIPRITVDQLVWGEEISKEDLEPGDLIFANSGEGKIHTKTINFLPNTEFPAGVDHVLIYIGNDEVIHSTRHEGQVVKQNLNDVSKYKNIVSYRRMIDSNEERYVVKTPFTRLDINTPQDLIEEIGRVYGYEKIEESPVENMDFVPEINKEYYFSALIKKMLIGLGFSEVMTYTFVEKGEVEPIKPIAEDKRYLRTTLLSGIKKSLELNSYNADLLGLSQVNIFELGKVYFKDREELMLAFGVSGKDEIIKEAIAKLEEELKIKISYEIKDGMTEISVSNILENISAGDQYIKFDELKNDKYKAISIYPFVLRDIAVWVPNDISEEFILNLIKENSGNLLVQSRLFDRFEKEGNVSYAFRLVFQSYEKTLTDDEVNQIMQKVTDVLNSQKDWKVR
jgi:phenylalanyl-tRNA synthetase beta subunit